MPEAVGVLGVGFEVRLHEPLKPVALVALGEGVFAVVGQEGLEGHGLFGDVKIYTWLASIKDKPNPWWEVSLTDARAAESHRNSGFHLFQTKGVVNRWWPSLSEFWGHRSNDLRLASVLSKTRQYVDSGNVGLQRDSLQNQDVTFPWLRY